MTVGLVPGSGPQLIDGVWANGVAAGQNASYLYGVAAAGSNQAGSTQLAPGYTLIEVDTNSGAGVALPEAVQGTEISIYNNSANTLTVYPAIANNSLTGSQDTINNGTSTTATAHTSLYLFCAKNGNWAAK